MRRPLAVLLTDTHLSDDTVAQNQSVFAQALALAQQLGVTYVLHGGDVLNSRKGQSQAVVNALRAILDTFAQAEVHLVAIAGNHDKTSYVSEESFLDAFRGSHFSVAQAGEKLEFDQVELHFLPYFDEALVYPQKLLECVKNLSDAKDAILITHAGINGARTNGGTMVKNELGTDLFHRFKKVLVGHYHDRQEYGRVVYVGSTDPRTFGENNEKGVTVLYDDGSHEFVNLQFEPFVTVDLVAADLTVALIEKVRAKATEAHVRLRVEGTLTEQVRAALTDLNGVVQVELHREVLVGDVPQVTREVLVGDQDLVNLYHACAEERAWSTPEYGLKLLQAQL